MAPLLVGEAARPNIGIQTAQDQDRQQAARAPAARGRLRANQRGPCVELEKEGKIRTGTLGTRTVRGKSIC